MDDVAKNTLGTVGMGSFTGVAVAILKGYSVPATAFSMGLNWGMLALPFYTIRHGMMSYRRELNKSRNVENWVRRDADELLSSGIAGGVVGLAAGYIYKGKYGVSPGFFMFTGIAVCGQLVYTGLRHLRIYFALKDSTPAIATTSLKEKIHNQKFKPIQDIGVQDTRASDPFRNVFERFISTIGQVVDFPEWASPLVNALDPDYRKRLNYRIRILQDEIEELEKQRGLQNSEKLLEH